MPTTDEPVVSSGSWLHQRISAIHQTGQTRRRVRNDARRPARACASGGAASDAWRLGEGIQAGNGVQAFSEVDPVGEVGEAGEAVDPVIQAGNVGEVVRGTSGVDAFRPSDRSRRRGG